MRGALSVAAVLAAVAPLAGCSPDQPVSQAAPPRSPVALYRAPQAIDRFVAAHPTLTAIAREPQFTWLGERDGPDVVRRMVQAAGGQTVPLVLYAIPHRDAGAHSAGGFGTTGRYAAWVRSIAEAIGPAPALVVVEPDAVGQSRGLQPDAQLDRLSAISGAVTTLRATATRARIYLDASMWVPLREMAALLAAAGVERADGVSLNVSNYRSNEEVYAYGNALSSLIGGRHYIVDSSRNGRGVGPDPAAWCNVPGRGLGARPGTVPADQPLVDGLFWVKHPGVSDGPCNGGPAAGVVWPAMAEQLVTNSKPGDQTR